jgi:hypothetical protein
MSRSYDEVQLRMNLAVVCQLLAGRRHDALFQTDTQIEVIVPENTFTQALHFRDIGIYIQVEADRSAVVHMRLPRKIQIVMIRDTYGFKSLTQSGLDDILKRSFTVPRKEGM